MIIYTLIEIMQKSAEFLRVLERKILDFLIHLRQWIFNCTQAQHKFNSDRQSVRQPIIRARTDGGNNCSDAQPTSAELCHKSQSLRCTEPARKNDRKRGEIRKIETDGGKQREILDIGWMGGWNKWMDG